MKIIDILNSKKTISFEFFPPKQDSDLPKLYETVDRLSTFNPDFVSFTYGAGGNTRQLTTQVSKEAKLSDKFEVMSHLTCIAHNKAEIINILKDLTLSNIENIIALRGDIPKDMAISKDNLKYATDLIEIIKSNFSNFCIAGACYPEYHPESNNSVDDIKFTKMKQDKGVDFLITQLFFDNKDFLSFREKAIKNGITIPIIPGILPITSTKQIRRFTKLCGAKIPLKLNEKLENSINDDQETTKLGIEYATNQILELIDNDIPGIHFYSLNKTTSVGHVLNNLGISNQTPEYII